MTSAPSVPTFDQAFVRVLAEAMDQTQTDAVQDDDWGDDEPISALFIFSQRSKYFIMTYPTTRKELLGRTKVVSFSKETPEGVSEQELNERRYYLGQRETRADALILASMFADNEEKITMMPTLASLIKT